ncbi:1577_t:CDS:2 [Racocetra persica]|uniref:1577_t:CDS:1 n=1 Tax=Racocetra persica TaxID=160502 RepID=A0ACA9L7C0_9GLOM|nr:1577_t:CDS:2 [Racocetra persica]
MAVLCIKKPNLVMGIVSMNSLRQGVVVICLWHLALLRDKGISIEKDKSMEEENTNSNLGK